MEQELASLLTIEQVCKQLGLGYTKVNALIKREGLPVVRFGRAVRIHPHSLQQWLREREQQHSIA